MNEREFDELAAGHALRALSPADEDAYREALAAHPEWRIIADRHAATAASLGEDVAPVTPPPALRDALLERLDETPQWRDDETPEPASTDAVSGPADADPVVVPRRRRRAWFALAASLALILAIGAGAALLSQETPSPAQVALERIESAPDAQEASGVVAGGGEAVLHWSESVGQAVLVAGPLPSITTDQTFELWYIRDGVPVPAGTFDASGETTTAILDPGMVPGDLVAVTVEPEGGSPDGAPTSDPIVAIETA